MKKFASFFALIAFLNLLILLGVIGFLVGTNRLDSAKAHTIADLLRHPGAPASLRDQVNDLLDKTAPATAPAAATGPTTQAGDMATGLGASAEDRLAFAHQAMEQERLRLQTQAQDLQHRQELLAREQSAFAVKLDSLEKDKKAFDQRVAATTSLTQNDGFQKTLALYDTLKPTQIKDLFLTIPTLQRVDTVSHFLLAMDPDRAGKIIGEFQTPEEQAFIATVLEHIRTTGTHSAGVPPTAANSAGS